MENVLNVGLIPLLCVGESLEEREADKEHEVIAHQLSILQGLDTKNIAVAYEPVWAIGTIKIATVEQIADMHAFIYKEILSLCGSDNKNRVLYGGSVKADNVADIFAVQYVDAALVGGASMSYDSLPPSSVPHKMRRKIWKRFKTLIWIVNIISALAVVVLVLLQHGKGADSSATFGSGSGSAQGKFGSADNANLLRRSTAVAATFFFATCMANGVNSHTHDINTVWTSATYKQTQQAPKPTKQY